MANCSVCGLGLVKSEEPEGICFKCKNNTSSNFVKEQNKEREEKLSNIMLTTESDPDLHITRRIEIITAECVFGMNLFRDFFSGVRDIVGGRSGAMQKVFRQSKETVLKELREEALSIGGNAVIGINIQYNEISGGGGGSMLMVAATGTAVIIETDEK